MYEKVELLSRAGTSARLQMGVPSHYTLLSYASHVRFRANLVKGAVGVCEQAFREELQHGCSLKECSPSEDRRKKDKVLCLLREASTLTGGLLVRVTGLEDPAVVLHRPFARHPRCW